MDGSFWYPKLDLGRPCKFTCGRSQNPISIDLDGIYTLFGYFVKNPKSAQIAPPWGVDFFAIRSQHTGPIQPSGGSEEIEL